MKKLTIKDVDIQGRRAFIRVDFNVPLTESGEIRKDSRIQAALPTIRYAIDQGAKVILASHMGRPKGKVVPGLSLKPVAQRLAELLKKPVGLAPDCVGTEVEEMVGNLQDGDVLLLENLRFHKGETDNDPDFAAGLAKHADVAVNDAFGTAHRGHASNLGVASLVKPAVAGLCMAAEIDFFNKAMTAPERPVAAILGGSKVSTKIGVIEALLEKVDAILIGGGMAFTFFKARGGAVGNSLVEEEMLDIARAAEEKAKAKGVDLLLPMDSVIAKEIADGAETRTADSNAIPDGWMGLDIGPEALKAYGDAVKNAKTVIWNGPMGVFETEAFARGTFELAKVVGAADALSVIGGGDTDAAIKTAGVADQVSYISTGGGAFLELLEGKELPGITSLTDA